jgi:predicted O-methyltransferase YrrM
MTDSLWTAVDEFLASKLFPEDPVLEAAQQESAEAGLPSIQVTPQVGSLLHLLARLQGSRRILEIGTLGGYSTIWLARALPADGRLVTLEIDPHHAAVAARNLERAGLTRVVTQHVGAALDLLPWLEREDPAPFDFIFIDADKVHVADYFRWAVRLSRAGSVIVVDNIVRKGAIVDGDHPDPAVQGVRRLLDAIPGTRPHAIVAGLQIVGTKGHDGLLIALVERPSPLRSVV